MSADHALNVPLNAWESDGDTVLMSTPHAIDFWTEMRARADRRTEAIRLWRQGTEAVERILGDATRIVTLDNRLILTRVETVTQRLDRDLLEAAMDLSPYKVDYLTRRIELARSLGEVR